MSVNYHVGYATERWNVTKKRQRAEKLRSELHDRKGNEIVPETVKVKEIKNAERSQESYLSNEKGGSEQVWGS